MDRIRVIDGVEQGAGRAARRPETGTDVWLAIDISRSKLVHCVRWDGAEQRRLSTPFGFEHVGALVGQYTQCRLHVAYEACGFGYRLAWWLQERGVEVTVIAPSRVERPPGLQVKTDRLDAGKMARKLERGELKGIYVPSPAIHQQRQLGRTYAQCIKERKRAQVRVRSLMQEQGYIGPAPNVGWRAYCQWLAAQKLVAPVELCVGALRQMRESADGQAQQIRVELQKLIRSEPYKALVRALSEQPGVGPMSAIRLVLELGDMCRFRTTDSLPHYLGLTPSEYSSGELEHRGHIMKCGPAVLRGMLIECAWAAVRKRSDEELAIRFERLAPRIGRKRAIVAVARCLAIKLRRRWLSALDSSTPLQAA
jgi:transposase